MKAELDSLKAVSMRAITSATEMNQVSGEVSALKSVSEQALEGTHVRSSLV
jgi:hypothetical protein